MEVVPPSAPGGGGDGGPPGGDDPEWIARMLKRMHERGMAEYRNTKQAMRRNRGNIHGFEDINVIIVSAAAEAANPQPAQADQIPEAMAAPGTHAPAATDPAPHMHTSYEMADAPAATDEAPAATDEQPAAAEAPAAPGPAEAAAEAPAAPEPADPPPMLIIDEETDVCTNRHIYVTNLNEVCCFDCVWCLLSVVC